MTYTRTFVHPRHGELPVPWVTMWSREATRPPTFKPSKAMRWNIRRKVDTGQQGAGTPQWARVSSERVWQCITRGLCQVCGDILPSRGGMFRDGDQARPINLGGDTFHVSTEAPTCIRCVSTAERHCPDVINNPTEWFPAYVSPHIAFGLWSCDVELRKPRVVPPALQLPSWAAQVHPGRPEGLVLVQAFATVQKLDPATIKDLLDDVPAR